MSSSRILSSRPSASCITAKPMARTIKGRGRNAPPFFAAQKLGKLRAFPLSPPGTLLYGFPSRKPHGSLPGHWRFCATQPEVGKLSGLFPRAAGGIDLWLAAWNSHSPPLGHWAFPHRPTGSGKPSGLFHQRMPGALLYGSLSRKPYSPLPGHCGGAGASASHCRKWEPCHKRKKRRKFPPLF